MLMDQPSLPSGNYTIYPWREESQEGAPTSSWKPDTIRPIPAEVGVRVYCDMETDGGGYTMYAVDYGIETSNHSAPNSCHDVGMDIVVPRSKAHWVSLLNSTGESYFSLVPGIYKPSSGGDYSTMAMNSANVPNWIAVDHGSWWLSDVATGEPTGDYLSECWLSMSDWKIGAVDSKQMASGACTFGVSSPSPGGAGAPPRAPERRAVWAAAICTCASS